VFTYGPEHTAIMGESIPLSGGFSKRNVSHGVDVATHHLKTGVEGGGGGT